MLLPDVQENPAVHEMEEPGSRPSRVLSCSVIGEAQLSIPNNSVSLEGGTLMLGVTRSKGSNVAVVSE